MIIFLNIFSKKYNKQTWDPSFCQKEKKDLGSKLPKIRNLGPQALYININTYRATFKL